MQISNNIVNINTEWIKKLTVELATQSDKLLLEWRLMQKKKGKVYHDLARNIAGLKIITEKFFGR